MTAPVGARWRGGLLPWRLGSGLSSAKWREGNPTAKPRPLTRRAVDPEEPRSRGPWAPGKQRGWWVRPTPGTEAPGLEEGAAIRCLECECVCTSVCGSLPGIGGAGGRGEP